MWSCQFRVVLFLLRRRLGKCRFILVYTPQRVASPTLCHTRPPPCRPHLLLGEHEARGRRRALRQAPRGDQLRLWLVRGVLQALQDGRSHAVRLRLGLARVRLGRRPLHRQDPERRDPARLGLRGTRSNPMLLAARGSRVHRTCACMRQKTTPSCICSQWMWPSMASMASCIHVSVTTVKAARRAAPRITEAAQKHDHHPC